MAGSSSSSSLSRHFSEDRAYHVYADPTSKDSIKTTKYIEKINKDISHFKMGTVKVLVSIRDGIIFPRNLLQKPFGSSDEKEDLFIDGNKYEVLPATLNSGVTLINQGDILTMNGSGERFRIISKLDSSKSFFSSRREEPREKSTKKGLTPEENEIIERNKDIFKKNEKIMTKGWYKYTYFLSCIWSPKVVAIKKPSNKDTLIIDPKYNKGRINDFERIKQIGGADISILEPKNTKIEVLNEDCLNVAKDMKDKGFNPIVLNMANQISTGGAYTTGARAQEEDICRRTTLFAALNTTKKPLPGKAESVMKFRYKKDYFIPEFGCLLSRNVQVLRDSNYQLLDKPEYIDVLSSAAYDLNPRHIYDRKGNLNPRNLDWAKGNPLEYKNFVKEKIRTMLKAAILSGHNAIVLSAFGCGAFNNDPKQMAKMFNEVLNENVDPLITSRGSKARTYKDAIKAVFAIITDHNDKKGNFEAFQKEFI